MCFTEVDARRNEKLRNEIVDYNYEVARHFYSYSVVRSNLRAFIASLTGY